MPQRLARKGFRSDSTANFATLTALFAPVAIGLAAVAVDAAALYTERRHAQSLADLAAITATANITRASAAALTTFADNGVAAALVSTAPASTAGHAVRVVPGRYNPDPGLPPRSRFTPSATPANAVRVDYAMTGTRHFGKGLIDPPRISVSALASGAAEGAFSIGTRLVGLNGGIANSVLGELVGVNLSLSVMDYNALLDADIDMFGFLDTLAGDLGVTAGTYNDLLDVETSVAALAGALATVSGLTGAAGASLNAIASSANANALKVRLGDLIGIDAAGLLPVGSHGGGASASARVLEMLSAAGAIANGSRQLEIDLAASLPGLISVTLDLAVGEPPVTSPWFAMGAEGRMVRTAQSRLSAGIRVTGPGGLLGTSVNLPVYVELASAEATLTAVSCPTGHPDSARMTVAARPGVAELRIAEISGPDLDDFTRTPTFGKATLVAAPLVTIRGQARLAIANGSPKAVAFDARDIKDRTVKSVSTTSLVSSVTASLIDDLDLQISVAGLGIGIPTLASAALSATLEPIAPAVDAVLFSVLAALGIRIGEVDIRALGVDCGSAVLVQ